VRCSLEVFFTIGFVKRAHDEKNGKTKRLYTRNAAWRPQPPRQHQKEDKDKEDEEDEEDRRKPLSPPSSPLTAVFVPPSRNCRGGAEEEDAELVMTKKDVGALDGDELWFGGGGRMGGGEEEEDDDDGCEENGSAIFGIDGDIWREHSLLTPVESSRSSSSSSLTDLHDDDLVFDPML
jgi:hypothetical protein